MNSKKIFIAGHKGLVGSAIKRRLELEEDIEIHTESKENLNLLDKEAVLNFLFQKSLMKFIYVLQELAVFMQIIHIL